MDQLKIGKNIKKMFIKDSNLMKNSPNFAFFSIQTNKNPMKGNWNNFKSEHHKKESNFNKDNHPKIAIILISQIN